MKIKFKISELANQLFFISNLSEWHFSCRKQYNQIWRGMLPPFTKEQEKSLRFFGKVLKKYEKSKGNINFPILRKAINENNIDSIALGMNKNEKEVIKNTFRLFRRAFRQIWQESNPRLRQFISLIQESKHQRKIEKSFKIIELYFGKSKCDGITAYLLMAPQKEWGGGGGNIGPGRLTMEIGDISPLGINWSSKTFIHETTHKCYQDNFKKLLRAFVKSSLKRSYKDFAMVKYFGELETVLNEAITSSIVEEGIIDRLIFKFSSEEQLKRNIIKIDWTKSSLSSLFRKSAVLALYPLNLRYLENKKSIELEYIEQAFKFLKKFEAEYKKGRIKELAFL